MLPVVAGVGHAVALARHGLSVEVLAERHLLGHRGLLEADAEPLRLRAVGAEQLLKVLGLGVVALLLLLRGELGALAPHLVVIAHGRARDVRAERLAGDADLSARRRKRADLLAVEQHRDRRVGLYVVDVREDELHCAVAVLGLLPADLWVCRISTLMSDSATP